MLKPWYLIVFLSIFLFALLFIFLFPKSPTKIAPAPPPTISPQGKVQYPEDYTFVLLGDSMTAALGNSVELKADLSKYYPNKTFEFLNYGFGSTNILSVEKRLTDPTTTNGRVYRPILNIDFNVILIESFGHNPLSEFPLEEGLKKQNEALDKIVSLISQSNPKATILFVATIAPNRRRYGEGQIDLSSEQRAKWADERTAYIKNHIEYAKSHNIPLINIYKDSLVEGDGNLEYIDTASFIHPSPNGIIFISHEIANFIFKNKILK